MGIITPPTFWIVRGANNTATPKYLIHAGNYTVHPIRRS